MKGDRLGPHLCSGVKINTFSDATLKFCIQSVQILNYAFPYSLYNNEWFRFEQVHIYLINTNGNYNLIIIVGFPSAFTSSSPSLLLPD
jgi:hypothetical protein